MESKLKGIKYKIEVVEFFSPFYRYYFIIERNRLIADIMETLWNQNSTS